MDNGDTNNQPPVNGKELVRDENGRVVSGVLNPNGRPKKEYSVTEMIKQIMDEKPEIRRALATKLLEIALKGDLAAIRESIDRLEGKPAQKNIMVGDDDGPIRIDSRNQLNKVYGSTNPTSTGELPDSS